MAKRRNKPHDPAEAERTRAEREANRAEIKRLEGQGVAVNVDPRTGRLTAAWRLNCFNALLERGSPEMQAVDWFEELHRTAYGENTPERTPGYVPNSTEGAPGQNISDAQIFASRIMAEVQDMVPPALYRMMLELLEPAKDRIGNWRGVVEKHTRETHAHAQGAAVRSVCSILVWAKDEAPRRAAERNRKIAA